MEERPRSGRDSKDELSGEANPNPMDKQKDKSERDIELETILAEIRKPKVEHGSGAEPDFWDGRYGDIARRIVFLELGATLLYIAVHDWNAGGVRAETIVYYSENPALFVFNVGLEFLVGLYGVFAALFSKKKANPR